MASTWGLEIFQELRPCCVRGDDSYPDQEALFHRWVDLTNRISQVEKTCTAVVGLVEYEDGSIDFVHPGQIQFIDNKFSEYTWTHTKGSK